MLTDYLFGNFSNKILENGIYRTGVAWRRFSGSKKVLLVVLVTLLGLLTGCAKKNKAYIIKVPDFTVPEHLYCCWYIASSSETDRTLPEGFAWVQFSRSLQRNIFPVTEINF